MALSILGAVLVEEYDRCERIARVCRERLHGLPKDSAEYKDYRRMLRECKADMRKIHRALGFSLRPELKRFREECEKRKNDLHKRKESL